MTSIWMLCYLNRSASNYCIAYSMTLFLAIKREKIVKYLHTMIRVGDLQRSIDFYSRVLGFKEVRRADYPEGKFTLVFLQAPDDEGEGAPMLELTYNYGVGHYDLGTGYGHIALQVESMEQLSEHVSEVGAEFSWGPGKTPDGKKKMAFINDPDGYQIELIEFS